MSDGLAPQASSRPLSCLTSAPGLSQEPGSGLLTICRGWPSTSPCRCSKCGCSKFIMTDTSRRKSLSSVPTGPSGATRRDLIATRTWEWGRHHQAP